jgi:toluene monooxygenase system ferredoxin subunit
MPCMARVPLCKVADVPVNGVKELQTPTGAKLCVVNAGDSFFACQASCPHEGVALCEGVFDGDVLTCLEHLWQWSLRAGGDPRGLAEKPLEMFPVEIEGDAVYLAKDRA